MAELIDIYDANLRHLGVMERKQAHLEGHWHRAMHCWIYTGVGEPSVLFQLRGPEAITFPNRFHVSVGGHLTAGETVEDAFREINEEIGITASPKHMISLGERVEALDVDGQRNREYQSVYLMRCDLNLTEFAPDPRDVSGLYWIPINKGLDLFTGRSEKINVDGIEYDQARERYQTNTRTVCVPDFVPYIQRYYAAILIAAERALEGKKDFAIS